MLNISKNNFFDKSPMHTPSKVLNSLDLLSINGKFISKSSETTPALTPVRFHRFHDNNRRKSLISNFDRTNSTYSIRALLILY